MSENTTTSGSKAPSSLPQIERKRERRHAMKNLRERVEEHRMWTDENVFQEQEYERRREAMKTSQRGIFEMDRNLQLARKCYLPTILVVAAGSLLLLCSSLDNLTSEPIFRQHQKVFQITGGLMVGLGVVGFMATAVYTYNREDIVRAKFGLPSIFESSKIIGYPTNAVLERSYKMRSEFVDRIDKPRISLRPKLSQISSIASVSSQSNDSCHSSTAPYWTCEHAPIYQHSSTSIRRLSSDTALDQRFALAHFLVWKYCPGIEKDQSEQNRWETYTDIEGDHFKWNQWLGMRNFQASKTLSKSSPILSEYQNIQSSSEFHLVRRASMLEQATGDIDAVCKSDYEDVSNIRTAETETLSNTNKLSLMDIVLREEHDNDTKDVSTAVSDVIDGKEFSDEIKSHPGDLGCWQLVSDNCCKADKNEALTSKSEEVVFSCKPP